MKKRVAKGAIVTLTVLTALSSMAANGANTGPNVKRATSGVCYARGDRGYNDVQSFIAFESLDACVNAGGRLPNMKGFFGGSEQRSAPAAAAPVSVPAPAKAAENTPLFDTDDPKVVKKSRDGVCHDASSAVFADTVHFVAYRTMQDCLQSGGRK